MGAVLLEGGGAVLLEGGGAVLLEGSTGSEIVVAYGDASDRQSAAVAVLDRETVGSEVLARDEDRAVPYVDPFGGYRPGQPASTMIVRTGDR